MKRTICGALISSFTLRGIQKGQRTSDVLLFFFFPPFSFPVQAGKRRKSRTFFSVFPPK